MDVKKIMMWASIVIPTVGALTSVSNQIGTLCTEKQMKSYIDSKMDVIDIRLKSLDQKIDYLTK